MHFDACLTVVESEVALEVSWFDGDDTFHHFIYLRYSGTGSYTRSRRDFRTEVISY